MEKFLEFIKKHESSNFYLLAIGLLAAMFFTATFLINKSISIDGGHWYWSGTLRFIIASLFVLAFYGKKLSKKVWFFTFFIFIGVCLVNFNSFDINELKSTFIGFIAVLVAAFAYPIGNQMVWEEKSKRHKLMNFKTDVLENAFAKVFLMTLGSFPIWLILFFTLKIDFLPNSSQVLNVLVISLLSGVIATSLFLYARSKANSSKKIMLVDAAQSGEVVFALAGEIIFLNLLFPSFIAIVGVLITIFGLVALLKLDN